MKNIFLGKRTCSFFSKVMHLTHCISFTTNGQNFLVSNIIDVHLVFYDFSKIQQKMCLIILFKPS
jgi:hypothetical protein